MQDETTLAFLISQGFNKTILNRFWTKVNRNGPVPQHLKELGPCWLWTGWTLPRGYGLIGRGGRGNGMELTHRVSWLIHFGVIPWAIQILHRCDNPSCINPSHLFNGTQLRNIKDMISKNRKRVPCKLTESKTAEIRKIGNRMTQSELGKRYGVSRSQISHILTGKQWKPNSGWLSVHGWHGRGG